MILRDLRTASRSLLLPHNRGFSIASILTLALGIGAASAIFSVAYALLLAPLPYRDGERVLYLSERNLTQGLPVFSVSIPNFLSWREQTQSFDGLAAIDNESANLGADDGSTERVPGLRASANLWDVLGMPLIAGRSFTTAEDIAPGAPLAILGEGLWRRRFGGDPAILGRGVRINGELRTVVGIAAQDVGFASDIDVWLPLAPDPVLYGRGDRRLDVLGRLRADISRQQAQAELDAISQRLAAEFPAENRGWEGMLLPARAWIVGDAVRERVLTLFWAVVVLLLVACTNVANLQIARATARAREIGVRQALGAARSRLLMQMSAESAVLTVVGGALGIAFAAGVVQLAVATLPASTPRLSAFALDWRVALLAAAITGLSTIAFALAPLLVAMRRELADVLQQAGRTAAGGTRAPLRQALVVIQFAMATVLVIVAALLLQHFAQLQDAALGFRPERLLTARVTLPQENEDVDLTDDRRVYAQLLQEIAALPGVESAGIASEIPLGEANTSMRIATGPGPLPASEDAVQASWRVISSQYLSTLGVPLKRGRWFKADGESPRSMLLSEGLARRLWPDGSDPTGRAVRLSNNRQWTVVGVVGDVRQLNLGEEPAPTMYMSTSWVLRPTMNLVLRTATDPATLAAPLREVARHVTPEHPLFDIRTMTSVISNSVAAPRVQTLVLLAFGGASLLLAALGVAGVMAYVVARRTPELAVRMALGASPRRLVGFMLQRGLAMCAAGVLLGALLLLPLMTVARDVVGLRDASALRPFVASIAILAVIGLLACWLPTRRVTRISPSLALRSD